MMRLIKCFCVDAGDQQNPDSKMLVHWRERDWDRLWEAVRAHSVFGDTWQHGGCSSSLTVL
jgi:hypothetical protein